MIRLMMLAGALALATGQGAAAQEAVGDWIGSVQTPGAELTMTLHVETLPDGTLKGMAGSPDQTPTPFPVSDIVLKGDTLTFKVPIAQATYKATWDAAGKRWVGTLAQGGLDMPMTLAHGTLAPRPVVSGLDGEWKGVLEVPDGDLHLVLKVRTDVGGTLAMFSSPDQSPAQIAAALTRDGDAVTFSLKGVGSFDGRLSADGKAIDGHWRQFGNSLPLTLKRGG